MRFQTDLSRKGEFLNGQIVTSLTQADFYFFTMWQLLWSLFPDVKGKMQFINRTISVKLSQEIDVQELRRQLNHVETLRFTEAELAWFARQKNLDQLMFKSRFIEHMRYYQAPRVGMVVTGDRLDITVFGNVCDIIIWEDFILQIVTALYYRSILVKLSESDRYAVLETAESRLDEKLHFINARPWFNFSDYGCRRTFHRLWHDHVVARQKAETSREQFRGTSCVSLAIKHGLDAPGTNAHLLGMFYSGMYRELDDKAGLLISQLILLEDWYEMYGQGPSVMLPDTFTTKYFLQYILNKDMAHTWKGSRWDSGDHALYTDMWLGKYHEFGVDPKAKLIVYSDSLTMPLIDDIHAHVAGRIGETYGWGGNVTCDVGLGNLSTVVKLTEVEGKPVVKVPDNAKKIIGDPAEVARVMQLIHYQESYSREPVY